MIEIGRVCLKIAGREAGKICAIVDIDKAKGLVTIDGDVRRRKCNIKHIEAVPVKLKIKKGVSTEEVKNALKEAGFRTEEKKKKTRKAPKTEKPKKQRKVKERKSQKSTPAKTKATPKPKKSSKTTPEPKPTDSE